MGALAAGLYGVLGVGLLAGSVALLTQQSMAAVPLYDESAASDPVALARVFGLSLGGLGVATLAFAAVEAVDAASVVAVSAYAVAVLCIALVTTFRTRQYE
jgi:hypothetical protein